MNETKIMFKELLDQRLANKTGKINSSFLFKRLKVKDKELIKILTLWMDELIHQDQVDLIKLGKNKKEETVYMTKDYFLEKIKQHLLS